MYAQLHFLPHQAPQKEGPGQLLPRSLRAVGPTARDEVVRQRRAEGHREAHENHVLEHAFLLQQDGDGQAQANKRGTI